MRGEDAKQATMFSIISPERPVPQDHPLRLIKAMADAALASMSKIFGWGKTVGGFRRTRFRGVARTQQAVYFVGAAYNLMRMANLAVR